MHCGSLQDIVRRRRPGKRPITGTILIHKTKPVSIRLAPAEIEQERHRDRPRLIRTGLARGDNKALADRLMLIERCIVALEQQGRETYAKAHSIEQTARDLLAMFDALLKALTGESTGRAA